MLTFATVKDAQEKMRGHARQRRLALGLTQKGLSQRSGVSLATLRRFERTGLISLESFLKIMGVFGVLEDLVNAARPGSGEFSSVDEILSQDRESERLRGIIN